MYKPDLEAGCSSAGCSGSCAAQGTDQGYRLGEKQRRQRGLGFSHMDVYHGAIVGVDLGANSAVFGRGATCTFLLFVQQPDDFTGQLHQFCRVLFSGRQFADFHPWFYIFQHSPRLLVRLLIGLLPPSLHFSISTFSSASFFGSLMILACGNNSFQDICRLRHERHMGVVGLLFCLMLSSISRPLKKGGNTEFL